MMRMAEMVKKMLNQKMPKMLLNQPLSGRERGRGEER